VKRNREEYGIPLQIVTYQELYGWTMDAIVAATGKRNNCTTPCF
jgi:cytoplasmic tRNA 2-thiolation protein 1